MWLKTGKKELLHSVPDSVWIVNEAAADTLRHLGDSALFCLRSEIVYFSVHLMRLFLSRMVDCENKLIHKCNINNYDST